MLSRSTLVRRSEDFIGRGLLLKHFARIDLHREGLCMASVLSEVGALTQLRAMEGLFLRSDSVVY